MGFASQDGKTKRIPDPTGPMGVTSMKMNTCGVIVINV